ncbi:hypothetical protein [Rhizobium laguerreae]|uniref:hypothetical protein n=1 Tax=Rhizobium laguerreae TaxID=1076926 RepID=UPI001C906DBF|nr:hypothetical protein [Rhizobium laguerreae]MBY3115644.1 hypothetical protein [Rhizobium laguerreae]
MRLPNDTRIAGKKTVADWTAMKARLSGGPDPAAWTDAFKVFFKARLESRYFEPIRAIGTIEKDAGEGFAIVALHCSLIEFLAATLEGKTYKYQRNGKPGLEEFEYSNSSEMFVRFLESNEPFKSMFSDAGAAQGFYSNVRCGLLHEARTKGTWRIQVSDSAKQAIDVAGSIVYRNKMQAVFDQFVDWYGKQLSTNAEVQRAFIRKFDSLCNK